MKIAGQAPTGAHSSAVPPYQLHADPMVGALLQMASEHAQAGQVWTLTVDGDGDAYHLTRIADVELDAQEGGQP